MEQELTTTTNGHVLTQKVKIALIAHFQNAVTIEHLYLSQKQKEHVAIVDHVYWIYKRNPFLDAHAMFYELAKSRYKDVAQKNAYAWARRWMKMLEFVIDNMKGPSRKDREMKVRAATDRLMDIGMQTDNVTALAKGADLSIKLDHLDQPENEQADMSNVAFLPPVVTLNIRDVDDTKEDIDDEMSRRIMQKYGGYVDEKRQMIEDKVAVLEASRESSTQQ